VTADEADHRVVRRVVVLGNGGSGKTRFARDLADATGLALVELDTVFWPPDLVAPPVAAWRGTQEQLIAGDRWILDGDLGPYDALEVRVGRADTVVLLDVPTVVCARRAVRRSRARRDFWRWLLTWRRTYRPRILATVREHAPDAELVIVRSRADRRTTLADLARRAARP
jgi:adenylate kinase family enzyme